MRFRRSALLSLTWLLLWSLAPPLPFPARTVMWGEFVLSAGTVLREDLVQFGGRVTVEQGAAVQGTVYIFQGHFLLEGTVQGDMIIMNGDVVLGRNAYVQGTLYHYGGRLAVISGARVTRLRRPPGYQTAPLRPRALERLLDTLWRMFQTLVQGLVLGLLALLAGYRVAPYLERARQALEQRTGLVLVVGVSGLLLWVMLMAVLALSVVGLFLALALALLMQLMVYAAYVVLGYTLGYFLASRWPHPWPMPVWVALGTTLSVWALALVASLGCTGWLLKWLLLGSGVGALWVTRFGTLPPPPRGLHPPFANS